MVVVTSKVLNSDRCQVWKVANAVTATPGDEIPAAVDGWREGVVMIGTVHVDSTGATVDVLMYGVPVAGSSLLNAVPALSNNEPRAKYTKSGAVKETGRARTLPPYVRIGFTGDAAWDVDLYLVLVR
jgi:hypothetical protein